MRVKNGSNGMSGKDLHISKVSTFLLFDCSNTPVELGNR
jgi:hypothetical protein